MDVVTTKLLSIHIAALLPPTSTELDISHNTQVAAVLGIGLMYQSKAHRHMAEVLLSEIGLCQKSFLLLKFSVKKSTLRLEKGFFSHKAKETRKVNSSAGDNAT